MFIIGHGFQSLFAFYLFVNTKINGTFQNKKVIKFLTFPNLLKNMDPGLIFGKLSESIYIYIFLIRIY